MIGNELKIWCTYHDKNILKEYDLHNTSNIQLFFNDDFTLKKDNINYLHDYLGEMPTYYYVWKNQIKSNYIGFCQYRRHFTYINFDELYRNGIITYMNGLKEIYNSSKHIVNDFIFMNFINFMYYKYHINAYDYIFKNEHKIAFHSMYIFRWDIFNEVCDFMFGFLDYMTYNTWKNEDSIIHLSQYYHLKDVDYTKENVFIGDWYWKRAWSVINELLLGIFVNIKYEISINYNEKYYISLDENDLSNIRDLEAKFETWYKLNIKTGITQFYVNCIKLKDIITNNQHLYQYVTFKKPNYLTEIKLKLNQRIFCEDSLEFHKGNYIIKNIE